ncbi:chromosome segregation protein SMC [Halobacillus karajensis]|uniref:Chromosome partition protein Smc n=1 Tax=Halobacillus karajensis TaxID=195088 RepID=A0A024P1Q2_9BACI|nr:chromosome segregation protein SMC [Halobacillus karajensis]CDQ19769.1 Chromosome partition protein Smc [Halobacillus karajensis]CDQ22229.1 Chromosome partition protein Smc [Halobacillus karajensis]CDQ28070.1 Chromosome partition protein Smc [Halobacillus karajensis]
MFLKQLDTIGFKSFAERVTVDFVSGVTSVVGPNGSGKSNITDAIRWVLGEQSARSLRGNKMEDIIFAGSDSRAPLNMAEVMLTLDNSDQALPLDYQEVSVTRRVYRSGESEFYINNQTCRLKDIIDLFMDSGLGREAFSIISQGKVEEILSSKAEERRSIFEEAAGVLKYKQRKKKAESKLSETQENLNRVEDILHEIDGQLEPLKEQAAIAKDYLEKKDELKNIEISLLITQIEQVHSQWEAVLNELEQVKTQEREVKGRIEKEESSLAAQRNDVEALEASLEDLQTKLLDLTRELENLEGKKQLMKERHKHFEENKSKLEEAYEELSAKLLHLKTIAEEEVQKLEDAKEKKEQTKRELNQTNQALKQDIHLMEEKIEDLKSEYIELLNAQAAKRNEKQLLEKQLNQLHYKKGSQIDKFKDLRVERSQLEENLNKASHEAEELTLQREELEKQAQALNDEYEKNKQTYQEWQEKLYKGYQYLEKMRSKKEMLEEMKEDFSGYFQGVREVLKAAQKGQIPGTHGAVLELIDIPSHLLTAIETALGAQAQHIVVEDERTGRQAIHWLKNNNKGRATFLPLTSIQPRFVNGTSSLSQQDGYIGIAADLIHYDQIHSKAIKHLLGHIVIAENLECANQIARALNRKYRIVTLDGDVVNPGGSMAGGAKKQSKQSLFTREKELQELSEKIMEYDAKALDVESKVKQLKNILAEQEQEREQWNAKLSEMKREEYEKQSDRREMQVKLDHLNDQLHLFDQDQAQYDQDSHHADKQLKDLDDTLASLEKQLDSVNTKIEELTVTKEKQKEDEANLQEHRQKLQIQLAEQESAVHNQKEKADRYQQEKDLIEQELRGNRASYQQLMEVKDSNQTEADIQAQIEAIKAEKEKTSSSIQVKRKERQERGEKIQHAEQSLKEWKRRHQNYIQDQQQKEVKANRLDVELENMLHYLQEEYVMTFEKARRDYPDVEDIEEASTQVKLIKRSIEELGTVNLGAIDEYDRIKERYEFLKGQQDDLLEAKQTLHNVINEMDGEMERKFEDTFTKIRAEFGEVFRTLFGGGKADLKLTDPGNMLETGVDIVAQPPGKKLQNMSLLSGGERALTAIALLFSILRVRPVPFCVLDEVEAALDEANVDRFAKFLKEFSEETQFIVITHRKGTMEESDVLYGVTMQESGVSKLVSVRLEETPELLEA